MATYLPPTEELPIFDNQVFDIANNTALTYTEAKKYFVSYPIAQGTATITDLIAGEISYQSPASGTTFEIGTNQVSGGTIKIGPTGASQDVSVYCSNLEFKNNGINNATSNTGGDLSIANSQTSGVLNIGTGVRVTSGNGGAINIGNNASALNVAPINIGSENTTTTIDGFLTSEKNVYYTNNTATSTTTEYLQGGISVVNMPSAGTFAFGVQRLNKIVNVWVSGSGSKTITLPTSPSIGQMIFLRSGASAGSLTLSVGKVGHLLYPSNTNTSTGPTSIVMPLISASQWCYVAANRWMQMDTSISPLVDAAATETALEIGSKVVIGNIVIGGALNAGDISIASTQASGGTVTIGSSNTVTTISGKLTSSRGVLSGNTVYAVYDSFTGNQTISTSLDIDAFIVIFGGLGSSIFTIPSGFPTGQRLTFKSIASNNQTLRFTNKIVILSNGTQTGVDDYSFSNANVLNVIFNGVIWYQI